MTAKQKILVTCAHVVNSLDLIKSKFDVDVSDSTSPMQREELEKRAAGKDGLICVLEDRIDSDFLERHRQVKIVANVAVGYDNIDVAAATRHGVLVCNTPGVLDETTADMAFALLMAASRRVVEADRYVRSGQWKKWTVDLLIGSDVAGKTLGIIGLGRIGRAMARRARGFGMKVLYFQRNRLTPEMEQECAATHVELDQLLSSSDFVSIHCPLNSSTRHLLGKQHLELMKPEAILVNTARGAIVDEEALADALSQGKIRAAGLDVFEHEPEVNSKLLSLDNVVLAPHIGSASIETRTAMARLACQGVIDALSGTLPPNAVNPEVFPKVMQRLIAPTASK